MSARGVRLRRRRRRERARRCARTATAFEPLADRAADAARRLERATRASSCSAGALPSPLLLAPVGVLELAHREADVAVARAAARRGRADDLLQPGVACRWRTCARGDGRRPALVPALLEHVRRAGREPRRAAPRRAAARRSWSRSTRRMLGWRPRDLDLAYLPVPARQGHRAVHERPRLPAPASTDAARRPGAAERRAPTLAAAARR